MDNKNPVWPSGAVIKDNELTVEQWDALVKLQNRWSLEQPITVMPGLGYVMVDVGSMVLGIEPDGHVHS